MIGKDGYDIEFKSGWGDLKKKFRSATPDIRRRRIQIGVVILYIVAAFLTFGYGVNRTCFYGVKDCPYDSKDSWSVPSSVIWPIYWLGRAAIEVTKP